MYDLLVVGAGPAGASLAGAMADAGWQVLLVERSTLPRHRVCGEFLSPEAQASLQALGRLELVRGLHPCSIARARLTTAGGRQVELPLPGGEAWGLSRFALDHGLAQSAAQSGACLMTGATVTRIDWDEHHCRVDLKERSGRSCVERARAVIGAWGRAPAGRNLPRRKPDAHRSFVGIKCHLLGLQSPALVQLYLFKGGYAGLAPVEAGRTNFSGLLTTTAFRAAGGSVEQALWAAAALNPALGHALRDARLQADSAIAVAGIDTDQTPTPWHESALIGDAVTMVPPLCGDGQAMALRCGELILPLADRYLRGQITRQHWQQTYCAAWHNEFSAPVRTARLLQRLLLHQTAAEWLVRVGGLAPWLPTWLARATRGPYRAPEQVQPLTF